MVLVCNIKNLFLVLNVKIEGKKVSVFALMDATIVLININIRYILYKDEILNASNWK